MIAIRPPTTRGRRPPRRRRDAVRAGRPHWAAPTGCLALVILVASGAAALCAGDCNHDGAVTINEILSGVTISLGSNPVETCDDFDRDGDGRVGVDELVGGVANALQGCPRQTQAVVVTSSFFEGSYASVALDPPRAVDPSTPQRRVYRDAVVRAFDGLVYVVNRRFADNIQMLDPSDDLRTHLQCSTGNGTNPHDIAFVSRRKAYVTLFEEHELLIVNPSARADCKDFVLGRIDLSALADADGIPDMDQMAIVGDRLYVALQHLDINSILRLPAEAGALAVIDTTTEQVLGAIPLTGENPFGSTKGLTVRDGAIWVAEAGLFNVMDGGLERIDLGSGTASGFLVSESDLGGDITDFAFVSERRAYAIVNQPGFQSALVAFDPTTRQVLQTVLTTDGFNFADIELDDRGELFLADRNRRAPGLHVFNAADGSALTDHPLDLALPPFEIVFIP